jgi:dCTP deaminase
MVWNDRKIREWGENGGVNPFNTENVNPASLDLTLGKTYRKPINNEWSDKISIPENGVFMNRGDFILCYSAEFVRIPNNAASCLFLKSTPGRTGLNHSHSGWGDPGFEGQWTFELSSLWPGKIILLQGQRIIQMVISDMCEKPENTYKKTGRYYGQKGPTIQR